MTDEKRHELIMGGTGGQGVITIGYILAAAASKTYKHVTRFPIYLATMRGGPAYCTVIFSEEEIAAPILSRLDNAIAMDSGAYARFKKEAKDGSRLIVNSSIVRKIEPAQGYRLFEVPANDLAQEMGIPRMANIIMLGAYREITGVLSEEQLVAALEEEFSVDEQDRIAALKSAFMKGVQHVQEK
jgi:2-oxoglutarate ferredoxin oxidoreductase subunit gamma